MNRYANTANVPYKIARLGPIPNIIEPPANDHLLEHGFGVTQMTSTDAILPDEIGQSFRDEQPWGYRPKSSSNLCSKFSSHS